MGQVSTSETSSLFWKAVTNVCIDEHDGFQVKFHIKPHTEPYPAPRFSIVHDSYPHSSAPNSFQVPDETDSGSDDEQSIYDRDDEEDKARVSSTSTSPEQTKTQTGTSLFELLDRENLVPAQAREQSGLNDVLGLQLGSKHNPVEIDNTTPAPVRSTIDTIKGSSAPVHDVVNLEEDDTAEDYYRPTISGKRIGGKSITYLVPDDVEDREAPKLMSSQAHDNARVIVSEFAPVAARMPSPELPWGERPSESAIPVGPSYETESESGQSEDMNMETFMESDRSDASDNEVSDHVESDDESHHAAEEEDDLSDSDASSIVSQQSGPHEEATTYKNKHDTVSSQSAASKPRYDPAYDAFVTASDTTKINSQRHTQPDKATTYMYGEGFGSFSANSHTDMSSSSRWDVMPPPPPPPPEICPVTFGQPMSQDYNSFYSAPSQPIPFGCTQEPFQSAYFPQYATSACTHEQMHPDRYSALDPKYKSGHYYAHEPYAYGVGVSRYSSSSLANVVEQSLTSNSGAPQSSAQSASSQGIKRPEARPKTTKISIPDIVENTIATAEPQATGSKRKADAMLQGTTTSAELTSATPEAPSQTAQMEKPALTRLTELIDLASTSTVPVSVDSPRKKIKMSKMSAGAATAIGATGALLGSLGTIAFLVSPLAERLLA